MRPETAKAGRSLADKRSNLNAQVAKGHSKQAPSNAKYYRENPSEIQIKGGTSSFMTSF